MLFRSAADSAGFFSDRVMGCEQLRTRWLLTARFTHADTLRWFLLPSSTSLLLGPGHARFQGDQSNIFRRLVGFAMRRVLALQPWDGEDAQLMAAD